MSKVVKTFLMTCLLVFSVSFGCMASERYVPDTSLINPEVEYVIIDEGAPEGATPVWVCKNPSCYNKQVLKTGVYESFIDTDTDTVYVVRNGTVVKEYKIQY